MIKLPVEMVTRSYKAFFIYERSFDGTFVDSRIVEKLTATVLAFSYAHAIDKVHRMTLLGRTGWKIERAPWLTMGKRAPFCCTNPPAWRALSHNGHAHIYFAIYASRREIREYEKCQAFAV